MTRKTVLVTGTGEMIIAEEREIVGLEPNLLELSAGDSRPSRHSISSAIRHSSSFQVGVENR
jgi:hypothetical protein